MRTKLRSIFCIGLEARKILIIMIYLNAVGLTFASENTLHSALKYLIDIKLSHVSLIGIKTKKSIKV